MNQGKRYLGWLVLAFLSNFIFQMPANAGLFGDLVKATEKPIVVDEKTDAKKTLADVVRSNDPAAAPRGDPIKRVAISSMQFQFITDAYESSTKKQFGIGSRPESHTSVSYKLESPSADVFQAIADHAKDTLEKLLAERGYEVIPSDRLLADADFAKKAAEAAAGRKVDQGFFAKNGSIVIHAKGTADTWGFGKLADVSLVKQLGSDVGLLRLKLVVNFASLEEMNALERFVGNAGSGIKHQVGLSIFSNREGDSPSRIELATATGFYDKPLLRTIYFPNPIDKDVRKEEISTSQAVTGALMSLMGGGAKAAAYVVTPADDYADQMMVAMDNLDRVLAEYLPTRNGTAQ